MTIRQLLASDTIQFLLFGGKGGVGKTSMAAASALWAADNGKRTLVISTDPAHSLGDSLGVSLPPGETVPVDLSPNLWALELDPTQLQKAQQEMAQMGGMGGFAAPGLDSVPLVGSMLGDIGSMTPPGADEAMAFGKVLEFVSDNESEYDLVVFDTAPTGHTLRLLGLPEFLSGWFGKLLKIRVKLGNLFGAMKAFFKREERERDDTLDVLEKLKEAIEHVKREFSDPARTSFVIVMIPEAMAIFETERLLANLYKYNIPASHVIVNQLLPESPDCQFCETRRRMQQEHLGEIRDIYSGEFELTEVPQFPREIRRAEQLRALGAILAGEAGQAG
ncbi:MAG: TRC40/GET3/ArsA family transport-energizing ATPase [Promethearchaeota archaeon]